MKPVYYNSTYDYWTPRYIYLHFESEEKDCEFGLNHFVYHPPTYRFESKINPLPIFESATQSSYFITMGPINDFYNKIFSDGSLKGCLKQLENKAVEIDKFYQDAKKYAIDHIEYLSSRIRTDRYKIGKKQYHELRYNRRQLLIQLDLITHIIDYITLISRELNDIYKEMNDGKLMRLKDLTPIIA